MHARDRERQIADCAEGKAAESAGIMTERERLEAESKGRRTATAVKTAGERLKDVYPGR